MRRKPHRRWGLEKASFRKTDRGITGCYDMVDESNVHQFQSGFQALRDHLIGLARLRNSRRMIVCLMCP